MKSVDERRELGKAARAKSPRAEHSMWEAGPHRPDPVASLEQQNLMREQDLVPVRRGRMLVSPFTFYRGAAKIMADDLAATPNAGLQVQLCGDAHLSNFGVFATPERNLIFDLNDFDETLRGPFEYDVKRLAASFTIASRHIGLRADQLDDAALHSAMSYRFAMQLFAEMGVLETWYARASDTDILNAVRQSQRSTADRKQAERSVTKVFAKARTKNSLTALAKLSEQVDGRARIVSQPPVVIPARELPRFSGFVRSSWSTSWRNNSPPTESRCRATVAWCSTDSSTSTWRGKSSALAASARGRSSCCYKAATNETRCSSR